MMRSVKYSNAYVPLEGAFSPASQGQALLAEAIPQQRAARSNDTVQLCCPSLLSGLRHTGTALAGLGRQAGRSIRAMWQSMNKKPAAFVPFDDPRSYEQIQDDRHREWAAVYRQSLLNNEHQS